MKLTGFTAGRLAMWGGVVLAAVLFLAVNVLSQTGLRTARLDLTEGGL